MTEKKKKTKPLGEKINILLKDMGVYLNNISIDRRRLNKDL